MGKYILGRVLRWIPSVLMLLLLIYALVFFGAGDPIKLIRPVAKDMPVSFADVELVNDLDVVALRKQMERDFIS